MREKNFKNPLIGRNSDTLSTTKPSYGGVFWFLDNPPEIDQNSIWTTILGMFWRDSNRTRKAGRAPKGDVLSKLILKIVR